MNEKINMKADELKNPLKPGDIHTPKDKKQKEKPAEDIKPEEKSEGFDPDRVGTIPEGKPIPGYDPTHDPENEWRKD